MKQVYLFVPSLLFTLRKEGHMRQTNSRSPRTRDHSLRRLERQFGQSAMLSGNVWSRVRIWSAQVRRCSDGSFHCGQSTRSWHR